MNIDERMDALLEDHKAMGARPSEEPDNGDAYAPTLPLREVGTTGGKTTGIKADKEAAPKPTRAKNSKK